MPVLKVILTRTILISSILYIVSKASAIDDADNAKSQASTDSLPSLTIPVFIVIAATNQLKISLMMNIGCDVTEVYQRLVSSGIIHNAYHSMLVTMYGQHLIYDDSADSQMLVDMIDPENPSQIRFNLHSLSDGYLLYKVFEDMSPNDAISWWKQAESCNIDPMDDYCSNITSWGFDEFSNDLEFISIKIAIESWTGTLNLKYLPQRVEELSLTGHSVTLDLSELKHNSLRGLYLGFNNITGIDLMASRGSCLEVLKLPHEPAEVMLDDLNALRMMNQTRLKAVEFGSTDRIDYVESEREYRSTSLSQGWSPIQMVESPEIASTLKNRRCAECDMLRQELLTVRKQVTKLEKENEDLKDFIGRQNRIKRYVTP